MLVLLREFLFDLCMSETPEEDTAHFECRYFKRLTFPFKRLVISNYSAFI